LTIRQRIFLSSIIFDVIIFYHKQNDFFEQII
jgi:hypothetical protein